MRDRNPASVASGNGNGKGSPEARIVGGIAEFGNDIATLVELQAKLFKIDMKECVERALLPLAIALVGLIVILGAVPVALLGVAWLLAVALKISTGWAMLLTGAGFLVVAAVTVAVSARKIGQSAVVFRRSREELSRNLAWIRTVLVHSGRGIPRRVR